MTGSGDLDLLMRSARAGDSAAYRRLLGVAADRLRAYYRRRLPERYDVEDLIQECLIAMHERRASHDPGRPVGPWMYAIARYKLADHFRRRGRRAPALGDEDGSEQLDSLAAYDVERLLGQLPEAQAEAIRLTNLEGLSSIEAARRTGSGISAVKVRVHRGIARLRALVREEKL